MKSLNKFTVEQLSARAYYAHATKAWQNLVNKTSRWYQNYAQNSNFALPQK